MFSKHSLIITGLFEASRDEDTSADGPLVHMYKGLKFKVDGGGRI